MKITDAIVEKHGLKPDEYVKIKELLSRENLIFWNLEFFQQCGMNIALINPHDYI